MKKGLVSIITPAYNSEKIIEETYESIRNQTYKNWEWIVIDDCSKDSTIKILEEISKNDLRIKILKNSVNLRAAGSRNRGLDEAKGEYLCFIDSDDLWETDFLTEQLNYIKEKNADVVFSSYERVSEDLIKSFGAYEVPQKIMLKDLLKTNHMSCLTTLYKAEKLGKLRFNSTLKMHEDYVMWLDFLEATKIAYGNNKVLAKYRIREGSTSRNKFKNLMYMFFIFYKIKNMNIFKSLFFIFNYTYFGLKKNKNIL